MNKYIYSYVQQVVWYINLNVTEIRQYYIQLMSKKNSVIVSKVSLSLSLETDCARDRTQGLFHRLLAIRCCTDGVQLTLQNLGGHLSHLGLLCRRLATCILQQCRWRRGRVMLQWLDSAPHRCVVTTDQRSEAPISRIIRSSPFSLAGDMHVPGGHRKQQRQRTQRDARNRGAAVAVVVSRCSRSL